MPPGRQQIARDAAELAAAKTSAAAPSLPTWMQKLPQGGRQWRVTDIDTGQQFGAYLQPPSQAEMDGLDDGARHRYEIRLWEEVAVGRTVQWRATQDVKIYQPEPAKPVGPPAQDPQSVLAWSVMEGLRDLKTVIARNDHHRSNGANPYMLPNGDTAVPSSSLREIEEASRRRVTDAENSARDRIDAMRRQYDTEIASLKGIFDVQRKAMDDRCADLEKRLGRAETESDRLRSRIDEIEDERDAAEREARKLNSSVDDLEADLAAANARASVAPVAGQVGTVGGPLETLVALAEQQKQFRKVAAAFGMKEQGDADAAGAEPIEVRKLRGYTDIAAAVGKTGLELLQEWQKGKPAPQPNGQASAPNDESAQRARFAAMFLQMQHGMGRSAEDTVTAARQNGIVTPDTQAFIATMPAQQFIQGTLAALGPDSALRAPTGQAWLMAVHAHVAGGGRSAQALSVPPAAAALPAFPFPSMVRRPLVPQDEGAPGSGPATSPTTAAANRAFPEGGRRFKDVVREMQAEAAANGADSAQTAADEAQQPPLA